MCQHNTTAGYTWECQGMGDGIMQRSICLQSRFKGELNGDADWSVSSTDEWPEKLSARTSRAMALLILAQVWSGFSAEAAEWAKPTEVLSFHFDVGASNANEDARIRNTPISSAGCAEESAICTVAVDAQMFQGQPAKEPS